MQEQLRPGDTEVIYHMARLIGTMAKLVMVVDNWDEIGIGFKSVSQSLIDTTTEHGQFISKLFDLQRLFRPCKIDRCGNDAYHISDYSLQILFLFISLNFASKMIMQGFG